MTNIRKITASLLATTLAFLLFAITANFQEKYSDSSQYFDYFGDVTTQTVYYAGEEVYSHAFGANYTDTPPDIHFTNELWCRPLNTTDTFDLISVASATEPHYVYWNEMDPKLLSRGISISGVRFSRISQTLEAKVRQQGADGQYGSWKLNNALPSIDSTCNIIATGTVSTPIFKYPKTSTSYGNYFDYIVSTPRAYSGRS